MTTQVRESLDRLPTDGAAEREAQAVRVRFLEGITQEALALIAWVFSEQTNATGTPMFQFGDPDHKLGITLEGKTISRDAAGSIPSRY